MSVETDADVGEDIASKCTKCKLDLTHTVVSKVDGVVKRVQCLTCGGQHNYRAPGGPKKKAAAKKDPSKVKKKTSSRKTAPPGVDLNDLSIPAKPYSTAEAYKESELLHHAKYSRGQVLTVRGDKIDVQFEGVVRTLIHGRRPS